MCIGWDIVIGLHSLQTAVEAYGVSLWISGFGNKMAQIA